MELKEHGHQDCNDSVEHESDLDSDISCQHLLVLFLCAVVVGVEGPLDALEPGERHGYDDEVGDDQHVNEEQDEKFAVPKSNTVVNPGAMMIHVQHAPVARGTMMAALRLKYVAHQAVSTAFILWVTQVESPEDRYLPRVRRH